MSPYKHWIVRRLVDSAGIVYVADSGNGTIRKITRGSVVTTLAGSSSYGSADGTGTAARFFEPTGVAVDGTGNLYVADEDNQTIRKVTSDAIVTTLAGRPRQVGSANGTGSAARFYDPRGIAVDVAGTLYVSDALNHTIRKITAAGNLYVTDRNRITRGAPVSSLAPPKLGILRNVNGISLSWPTAAAGFALETTDSIPPRDNWITETTTPVLVSDQNTVTINIGSGTKFFRLRKP